MIEELKYRLKFLYFSEIIIVICILIYLISEVTRFSTGESFPLTWFSNTNYILINSEVYRLFTSVFTHVNLIHLLFNMFSLYQVGRLFEQIWGGRKFLIVYVVGGLGGSIFGILNSISGYFTAETSLSNYILSNPIYLSVGASGAIFALLGYIFLKKLRERDTIMSDNAVLNIDLKSLGIIILLNLYLGFTSSNIDNAAHIGGLLTGVLLAIFL